MKKDKTLLQKLIFSPVFLARFVPFYLWEMTLSNLRVARDAFRIKPRFTPDFIDIDLDGYTPSQCWAAVCLISMTPGTLSLDLADGSTLLHVHGLYAEDPEQVKAELYRLLHKALGNPNE